MKNNLTINQVVRLVKVANIIEQGGYKMADMNIKLMLNEEQKKQKEKILNDIKSLDKQFQMTIPKEKEEYKDVYNKLDLKNINENELKDKAENGLIYFKVKGEKEIQDNFTDNKKSINNQIEKVKSSANEKIQEINKSANTLKEDGKNSFINDNIARSSIYDNFMTQVEKDEFNALQNVKEANDSKLNELNSKLNKLDIEKQNALELFDIGYAVKVQEKMDEMKKEINDYNEKAIKYNDSITQKEKALKEKYEKDYNDYLQDVENRNLRVLEFLQKYGYGTLTNKLYSQKYDIVDNYLNTLNKESAMQILTENDDFKNELGLNKFNQLLEKVKNRKN